MLNNFLKFYRHLPHFKGKLRLGRLLFKSLINKNNSVIFSAHHNILYHVPNTLENLGIELFVDGIYEKKLVALLKKNIKPGENYFDIGANIGAIGLPVIKVNPGVKYIGFEASPLIFEYLKTNFQQNNISNYELHNTLVHAGDNQTMKFYQPEQYGKSSLAPTFTEEHIYVKSISLDTFCYSQKINRINWMKVDVQGYELYVFMGMKQLLLNKKVNNIIFEFEYWAEEWAGLEKGAAQKYLSALGYDLFDLSGKKLKAILTEGKTMIWARPGISDE